MNEAGGTIGQRRQYWHAKTIRNGLILVVLAAMLPLAVLGLIQGNAAWRDSLALITNQLRANAWIIAEGERDAFVIARHTMLMASLNPVVRDIADGCNDTLVQTGKSALGVVNFARSDNTGRVRCSGLPFAPGTSFAGQEWWQRGIGINAVTLSKPTIGQISKLPVIVMMLPILDDRGAQDGAISASISIKQLQSSIDRRRKPGRDALIEIVGAQGEVLLSNSTTRLERPDLSITGGELAPLKARDGVEWMYATAPLQGKDLFVLYAEPRQNLMASARWQVRQSLILPLVAMILATLAIWLGTHWLVVRWLKKLQSLTGQFGRGDFSGDRAAYAEAPYEVAALGNDLYRMGQTIEERDTALTSALAAKTALTREVHHRVKNNLQIVTSLLTLQADRVDDPWAREVLGQAKARIAALGLIHRLLYQQDSENELGTVNMRLLMSDLCAQLRAANRARSDVDLQCRCEDIELTVDQAVPLTLFIVEGVTNAFRHGFGDERSGGIVTEMMAADGYAMLSIVDDGTGYVVADSTARMGGELMNAFATQLGATLDVTSDAQGTRVTLRYALATAP